MLTLATSVQDLSSRCNGGAIVVGFFYTSPTYFKLMIQFAEWWEIVAFANMAEVMWSFCLSFCKQLCTKNAETDVDQTFPAWARGDPLEVINFW